MDRNTIVTVFITWGMMSMLMTSCSPVPYQGSYTELYRPQFHFSPARGWMNDPNGLLYYDGEYHLFYQYLPESRKPSGEMHWGHAISLDLLHWTHLPVAIYPDQLGAVWSGSAVVDWYNTSGFQTGDDNVFVAIFTQTKKDSQQQSIAYSNDRGRMWKMYSGNPVIPNPGIRDPKVFWHKMSQRWVMVVAGSDRVLIYTSANLKDWAFTSQFGELQGSHEGVWECPDLFELTVDDDTTLSKWVLLVSVSNGSPNGGSGTQYFVGEFDGTTFTNDFPAAKVHWLDYGRDDYAGVTFSDIPSEDGRRIFMGWMNNWWYARDVPTTPWQGAMTTPHQLSLRVTKQGELFLAVLPVQELEELRSKQINVSQNLIGEGSPALISENLGGVFELNVTFTWEIATEFGIIVRNEVGECTVIGYDVANQMLFVDRRKSGAVDFQRNFAHSVQTASLSPGENQLTMRIYVDWSSVELFVNDGSVLMTNLVLPHQAYNQLAFYTRGGDVGVLSCEVWELGNIWRGAEYYSN